MCTKRFALLLVALMVSFAAFSQDDLESMLLGEMEEPVDYTLGTFLSSHVLNSHSSELIDKNGISFRVAHKFGKLNTGANHFFGFDNSNSFLEMDYAIANWWNVGVGRATLGEQTAGFTKFRLLRQSTGARVMPVSMTAIAHVEYGTQHFDDEVRNSNKEDRFDYTSQLLIARKFSNRLSLQMMPTYIHHNLVDTKLDKNDVAAVGFGASCKIYNNLRANAEYYLVQDHDTPTMEYFNPLSFGICYQTSRHAFEVYVTNAQGITESSYIANTTNDFFKGDVRIGFNISTVFTLGRKASAK
jgi:hypothetical protein